MEITSNIIIVGDPNEDLLGLNMSKLKDIFILTSLIGVITDPTRDNALRPIIIIHEDLKYPGRGSITVPSSISDHCATFITISFHYEIKRRFKVMFGCARELILYY